MLASACTLSAQRRPAGVRQESGRSGQCAVEVKGGERGLACTRRVLAASSLRACELNRRGKGVRSTAASHPR
jgi:hypothetical protein